MNNHLIGFSVSALLHGGVALLVLAAAPPPPPAEKVLPLAMRMFEIKPAAVAPPPKAVAVPVPKRVARKPKAKPEPKATPPAPRSEPPPMSLAKKEAPPTPKPEVARVEPPPAPEAPPSVALAEPPPAPAAEPPDPSAMARYADALASLIARHRSYPRMAQLRGWQGEVELELRIAPDGRLVDAQVSRSSGFDALDRHALKMARLARPLPQPPEALRSRQFTVLVPVVFRLGS